MLVENWSCLRWGNILSKLKCWILRYTLNVCMWSSCVRGKLICCLYRMPSLLTLVKVVSMPGLERRRLSRKRKLLSRMQWYDLKIIVVVCYLMSDVSALLCGRTSFRQRATLPGPM